ncbi:transporter substrate-binding domain-containing protein [Sphingomonas montanisoli]|uniref:Transporter substrate-binding domain-containing protein n=2 Tax=Sphingomonas montanisoli TaxID=2606412 RepID=A0A5D9C7X0_9SPHN|nr:transporter substrate-binding domain-containing protein [Sphingomonas montanisoli]
MPGFSLVIGPASATGLDADLCRAVARALLGDAAHARFVPIATIDQFRSDHTIDLVFHGLTAKPAREEAWGVRFAPVSFQDGQAIALHGDDPARTADDLDGAMVCVERDSIFAGQLRRARPNIRQLPQANATAARMAFQAGRCRGWSWDVSGLFSALSHDKAKRYRILPDRFSIEPLAPIIRAGDADLLKVARRAIPAALKDGTLYRRHFVEDANVTLERRPQRF